MSELKNALMLVLTRCQLHLFERGTAKQAIRIAESLGQFEVIVSFGKDEMHRFTRRLDRRGELAGLALKLG